MRPRLLHSVFGVTRLPSLPADRLTQGRHPSPHRHITLIIRDQIFSLDVKDQDGRVKTKDEIEKMMWLAIQDVKAGASPQQPAIGVLTGANRDSWTKVCQYRTWHLHERS